MLYMIIESFRKGDAVPVYRRFRDRGRLAPGGVKHVSSWVTSDMTRCYQLMECEDRHLLDEGIARWSDLVDFEVLPVITSDQGRADRATAVVMEQAKVSGSCLCGAVRFSVELPSQFCGHCHCSMCRRNHGAGYVTWFVVPRAQVALEAGQAELSKFRSSDHGTRSFCGRCGSSLFCESTRHPDQIDIVLANMAGPIDRRPECHIYFDDRVEWVTVDDDLPRLGGPGGLEPLQGGAARRD